MLLANYHHDKNYLFLQCEDKPYSFMDLKKIAATYHMDVSGVRVEGSKELENNKQYPFIVTLEKKKGVKHSVLVLGMSRKYVKIYDPETGKRKILSEIFYGQWDRKALIVNKEKGYQYHFYADTNKKDNDNVIYSASEFLVNPKDGTIYTLNPLNGSKVKYGQFKDNKMTITKDDTVVSILTGEYKKTKDPVPDQKTLDYNVWSAERDKLQAYKEKTENQPHTSKFEELSNARGWKKP